MKKRLMDGERAVIAHDQSPKVAEPRDTALDDPALLVASQHAPIWERPPVPVRTVCGLNASDQVFRFNPQTQKFDVVTGGLARIAVGADSIVWGLDASGQIFRFH